MKSNLPSVLETFASFLAIIMSIFIVSLASSTEDISIKTVVYVVAVLLIGFSVLNISLVIKSATQLEASKEEKNAYKQPKTATISEEKQREIIREKYEQQIERSKIIIGFLAHQNKIKAEREQKDSSRVQAIEIKLKSTMKNKNVNLEDDTSKRHAYEEISKENLEITKNSETDSKSSSKKDFQTLPPKTVPQKSSPTEKKH